MAYSDLSAQEDKELESFISDFMPIRLPSKSCKAIISTKRVMRVKWNGYKLISSVSATRCKLFSNKSKKNYLNEPDLPQAEKKPDISESQDKALIMMQNYRKQQADRERRFLASISDV
ncbi:hypothetical protein [uncultured Fibrella sp.]|uniref:hypothetical protein n=1 Tax=uncultured Fibrella sp. TaxID=1284596 RepID=UPI0035CB5BBE